MIIFTASTTSTTHPSKKTTFSKRFPSIKKPFIRKKKQNSKSNMNIFYDCWFTNQISTFIFLKLLIASINLNSSFQTVVNASCIKSSKCLIITARSVGDWLRLKVLNQQKSCLT